MDPFGLFGKVFDHAEDVGGLHDRRGEFRIVLEVLKAGAALFGHRKVAPSMPLALQYVSSTVR
ncbi:MAG: hypothetical protein ACLRWP_06660 [Bilophila wadsworthia]